MKKYLKLILGLLFVVTSLSLMSCGDSLSVKELLISRDQEVSMGEEFDTELRKGNLDSQVGGDVWVPTTAGEIAFAEYFDSLSHQLVEQISESDQKLLLPDGVDVHDYFKFEIIESDQVNAFAVMGGYVYFYTSILKEFENESEFSTVIGHEITHIVEHHSRDAMIKTMGVSTILGIVLGDSSLTASLAGNFLSLKNSRSNEYEADEGGITLTTKAGISPYGLTDYFGKNLEYDSDGKCIDSALDRAFGWFSTHPLDCDRVEAANELIEDLSAEKKAQPKNDVKYRAMLKEAFGV